MKWNVVAGVIFGIITVIGAEIYRFSQPKVSDADYIRSHASEFFRSKGLNMVTITEESATESRVTYRVKHPIEPGYNLITLVVDDGLRIIGTKYIEQSSGE